MNRHTDMIGRIFLAALLAAAIGLSLLTDAGAYPVDPGGGGAPPSDVATTKPTSSTYASPSTSVRLADRTVQLVAIPTERTGFMPEVGVCCSVDGETVDLASVTGINTAAQLAVDRQGTLSLVWEQYNTMRGATHQARIVQLDQRTLEPVGAAETSPGFAWSTVEAIACGSTCHLILQGRLQGGSTAQFYAWEPGESAATALHLPATARVLAAQESGGRLVVTYSTGKAKRTTASVVVVSFG